MAHRSECSSNRQDKISAGLGVGPGKRKANDYVLELMNNFLNSAKGKNFTKETMITAADALSFLHTIRKSVEDDLTGEQSNYMSNMGLQLPIATD